MRDEITVILTEEDFIEAFRPAPRPRRLSMLMLLFAFMLALLLVVLVIRYPGARRALEESTFITALIGAVVLAASLLIGLLIAAPALRRRAARSTLDDHPGMRDAVQYTFDAERFAVHSTYTQASYPWGQLWDWRETDQVVIVQPTPRNFYVVPKREVEPATLDRLRGYLGAARQRR